MMEERVTSFDGSEIHCRVDGDDGAPAVLLAHPIGANLDVWEPQVAPFMVRFRVIRYDARGHGRSAAPPAPYDLDMLGRDALAVLDAFGCERAHFVGLSLGGMVGMWLATRAPERIARLVLANTTPHIGAPEMFAEVISRARTAGVAPVAAGFLGRWLGPQFQQQQPERVAELQRTFESMPVEGFVGCCAVLQHADQRAAIRSIRAPTLVVTGCDEPPPLIAASEAMARDIPGAQLTLIEQAVHLASLENPRAFNHAVLGFLTGER